MIRNIVKEERAIVLDFLPNGSPLSEQGFRKIPVAQAVGKDHFILLELVPKKGVFLKPSQEVYTGEGKREEIHHILSKLTLDRLTQTAKMELEILLKDMINEKQEKFMNFFNKAGPINMRRHQLELLPGIGKKHMQEILEERDNKPFENFDDIKTRVKLMPNPEQTIMKRILIELNNEDKHRLFVET